ncbi:MAG: hypothetical protein ACI3ZC_02290 [Candidatus Cryptobacteroides sp.]
MASSTVFSEKRLVDEQNNVFVETSVGYLDNGPDFRRYVIDCWAYKQSKYCQTDCPHDDIRIVLFRVPEGCRRSKARDAEAMRQYEELKEQLIRNRIDKGFSFLSRNPLA